MNEDEREQWRALTIEPRLDMLPTEALIASIRHLAQRLLDLTEVRTVSPGALCKPTYDREPFG